MLTVKEFCEANCIDITDKTEEGDVYELEGDRLLWRVGTDYLRYIQATITDERRKK